MGHKSVAIGRVPWAVLVAGSALGVGACGPGPAAPPPAAAPGGPGVAEKPSAGGPPPSGPAPAKPADDAAAGWAAAKATAEASRARGDAAGAARALMEWASAHPSDPTGSEADALLRTFVQADFDAAREEARRLAAQGQRAEGVAVLERFLALPHQGGLREEEARRLAARLREPVIAGDGRPPTGEAVPFPSEEGVGPSEGPTPSERPPDSGTPLAPGAVAAGDEGLQRKLLTDACVAADATGEVAALVGAARTFAEARPRDRYAASWLAAAEALAAARRALDAGQGSAAAQALAKAGAGPIGARTRAALEADLAKLRDALRGVVETAAGAEDAAAHLAAARKFAAAFPEDKEARALHSAAQRRVRRPRVLEGLPAPFRVATETRKDRDAVLDGAAPLLSLEGHAGAITAVAFSPDGRRLATVSRDRTARVWDLATGARVLTLKEGQLTDLRDVAFSPDGALLAVTGWDNTHHQQHSVRLLSLSDGTLVRSLRGHGGGQGGINSVAFSRDGRFLVTAANDQTARIWNVDPGEAVWVLGGHDRWVTWAAFSPDGRLVATAGDDGGVRFHDPRTGKRLASVDGAAGAAFSPDGRLLATYAGGSLRLWETEKFREVRAWAAPAGIPVAFSPDGRLLLAGGRLWEVRSGALVRELAGGSAAFSPDGRFMAGFRGNAAEVWVLPEAVEAGEAATPEAVRGTEERRRPLEQACEKADAAGDLAALTTAAAAYAEALPDDTVAVAWRTVARGLDAARTALAGGKGSEASGLLDGLPSMAVATRLRAAVRAERDAFFSKLEAACRLAQAKKDEAGLAAAARAFADAFPDDRGATAWIRDAAGRAALERIASGLPSAIRKPLDSRADRAKVLAGEVPLHALRGHAERTGIAAVAFSPDGRLVASAGTDGSARVWDVAAGREIRKLQGHRRDLTDLSFTPDGRLLVTSSLDSTAKVWEVASGREVQEFNAIRNSIQHPFVQGVVVSPNGKLVASSVSSGIEKRLRIWLVESGHEFKTLEGVTCDVLFSPDNRFLFTAMGGTGGVPAIWDVATGREAKALSATAPPSAMTFSPDGKILALGHSTGVVELLEFPSGKSVRTLTDPSKGKTQPPGIASIGYAPGGRRLLTLDAAGVLRVWDPAAGALLRTLTLRAGLVFSRDFRLAAGVGTDGKNPLVELWVLPELGEK
ncbi:MAG: WD40 repeat domain-containing protein [Planctomycetales bacterium]|nr:WD40 repeat domain-containing protein [Planctomycetales bacterium]